MIKFIYFDIGGVLVKDFSSTHKWRELKRSIGIGTEQDEAFDKFFANYESEICVNKDIETLLPLITKEFGLSFSKNYSFLRDFVNRFDKNESIVPVINSIRKDIKLGLLSNMYPDMLNLIKENKLMPDIKWNVIIDSSVEGMLKPEKRIYKLAQKRAGVNPNRMLYVENRKTNTEVKWQKRWGGKHSFMIHLTIKKQVKT